MPTANPTAYGQSLGSAGSSDDDDDDGNQIMLVVLVLLLGIVCVGVAGVFLRQRWAADEQATKLAFDNPAYDPVSDFKAASPLYSDDPNETGYMDVPPSSAGMAGVGQDGMYCEVGPDPATDGTGYMDIAITPGGGSEDGSGYMDVAPNDLSEDV